MFVNNESLYLQFWKSKQQKLQQFTRVSFNVKNKLFWEGGEKAILQLVLTRKLRIVGNSRMERVHTGSQWLFSSSNREGFTEATASWGRDIKQD